MFRAQAALLASACLALAPAAFAETHHASHKAHAKGHAEETPSKAKLRRAAEADEPPAVPKAHVVKASLKGKHHDAADEEVDAVRSKSSKRHKTAKADEEADAAPSKASRPHGKSHHADEAADAAPSKSSGRHGKTAAAEEAEATTSKASKRRHEEARAEEDGADSPLIRADVRSTKACVAAHVRLHGRPHGSRARLALQRECAKEAEAARRHAEEQIAIRNWTPPHGPLIYQGALPRSTAPGAEPPIGAPPNPAPPISTLPADPAAAAPAASVDQTDTSTPPPSSAPAAGAATVAQTPAPQTSGGIFGLFRRRGAPAPERKPGEPAPTLAELVGSDETRLKAELGEPELMRAEGGGALWTYRLPACALYVFLGRDTPTSAWKVKGAQAGPLKRGEQAPDVDVCLKNGRS
jgi:hypothetical protein